MPKRTEKLQFENPSWPSTDNVILLKGGVEVFRGTQSQTFLFLLKHQPHSTRYALRWDGYRILPQP